jgi:arylsulfatase A
MLIIAKALTKSGSTAEQTPYALLTGRYPWRGRWRSGVLQAGDPCLITPELATLPGVLQQAGYRTALVGKWHVGESPEFGPKQVGFDEVLALHATLEPGGDRIAKFRENDRGVTAGTVEFLKQRAAARDGQPFFLYCCPTAPHDPYTPQSEWKGRSDYTKLPFAIPQDTDDHITVFERVKKFGHDSAGGWRGSKYSAYEAGHRIPFLVRWPGKVKAGAVSDRLVSQTDLLATCAAVAGTRVTGKGAEDSPNQLPAWLGEQDKPVRTAGIFASGSARQVAVRKDDWVLIAPLEAAGKNAKSELYDLRTDPAQVSDVAKRNPQVVAQLEALLALGAAVCGRAAEFTGFHGDGTGVYPNARPPVTWSATNNVLWRAPMPGPSFGQPTVIGEKVITMADPDRLVCVNVHGGRATSQHTKAAL